MLCETLEFTVRFTIRFTVRFTIRFTVRITVRFTRTHACACMQHERSTHTHTEQYLEIYFTLNPLTLNDLQKHRAVSPLKIKFPSRNIREKPTNTSQIATHHVTRHNTRIYSILSTAPQLSISQKALGTLPENGNVMPKHVGAAIHN
jgi:hypothetical protein